MKFIFIWIFHLQYQFQLKCRSIFRLGINIWTEKFKNNISLGYCWFTLWLNIEEVISLVQNKNDFVVGKLWTNDDDFYVHRIKVGFYCSFSMARSIHLLVRSTRIVSKTKCRSKLCQSYCVAILFVFTRFSMWKSSTVNLFFSIHKKPFSSVKSMFFLFNICQSKSKNLNM